ncbi:craniofacial development protein 2-like protein [Plakobranchus ocellatus]|uniref:Craniofacial development protein 2-like protein n=1 Tax=Plakobranchus ocellatus TaxID=259542 RepID=A0AAV4BA68_9GAST|nr:craniofacial development protein 2-like protein [Plakobranchus ocellatus]
MLQKGKLDNIKKEMNILGVSEVRWSGAGKIKSGKYEMYYSGAEHQRGVGIILDQEIGKSVKGYWPLSDRVLLLKIAGKPVDLNIIQAYAPTTTSSDEEIEKFYEELEMVETQCKSHEPMIIMGDFNAKVGEDRIGNTAGPHGLGKINERGERLVEWCQTHDLVVCNTWFEQPVRRKWTWKSPGDGSRNQIDYILTNERFRNAIKSAKTYPGADCYSDHVPVVAKLNLKLKKTSSNPTNIKLDLALLKTNQLIREKYQSLFKTNLNLWGKQRK